MRTSILPLLLVASFGLTTPVAARDLGDVIGEIAQSLFQQEVDRNAYVAAQSANTATAYRDYLAKFPKGQYRTNAESALVVTTPVVDPPTGNLTAAQIEAGLRLTRTQRTTIQRQLTAIGYDAGVADGLWGSRTRAAISAWQRANRGAQTGYVTAAQVKMIASQAGTVAPAPDVNVSGPALEESLLQLTLDERVDLQRRLRRLGYDSLRTDGTFGAGTRRAIAEWQADEGETATGYLSADQVRLIRLETGG